MTDTVKDTLHNLAEQLPESATWDDMMRKIYEHQIIESGLADSDADRVTPVQDVRTQYGLFS